MLTDKGVVNSEPMAAGSHPPRVHTLPRQVSSLHDGAYGWEGRHLDGLDKAVTAIAKGPPLSVAATP